MTSTGQSKSCVKWMLRAGPADYLLALSRAGAALPVIGKHLEPLGTVTAMSVWGMRFAPELVTATAKGRFAPGSGEVRRRERDSTNDVSIAALRGTVSPEELDLEWPAADRATVLGSAAPQQVSAPPRRALRRPPRADAGCVAA